MHLPRSAFFLTVVTVVSFASLQATGCAATSDDSGGASSEESEALSGNPAAIDIGFNGGSDQFDYVPDFFAASSIHPGPRLCHWYTKWNVADEAPTAGSKTSPRGSRGELSYWLSKAQGRCDEALISFQSDSHGAPPSEKAVSAAFQKFVTASWEKETGFKGSFAFTPWNEPNNPGDGGNGLGRMIEPETAAQYYLAMSRLCATHGCKVAAGDFASNGNMWNDFEWNCSNDNVPGSALCKSPSSVNTERPPRPASYLDRYKDYIANHADEFGLGKNFRPKYFAFHGWHDANEYLNTDSHCGTYANCATRRLLQSLGGSWGGVEIWDTEVGVQQGGSEISDEEQACGAAFLMRLSALSPRIKRVYYTRLHGGPGELLRGHTPRLALEVIAKRQTQSPSGHCR